MSYMSKYYCLLQAGVADCFTILMVSLDYSFCMSNVFNFVHLKIILTLKDYSSDCVSVNRYFYLGNSCFHMNQKQSARAERHMLDTALK